MKIISNCYETITFLPLFEHERQVIFTALMTSWLFFNFLSPRGNLSSGNSQVSNLDYTIDTVQLQCLERSKNPLQYGTRLLDTRHMAKSSCTIENVLPIEISNSAASFSVSYNLILVYHRYGQSFILCRFNYLDKTLSSWLCPWCHFLILRLLFDWHSS